MGKGGEGERKGKRRVRRDSNHGHIYFKALTAGAMAEFA